MEPDAEARQLAQYLRMLKDRTGRSFDALGRRAGVSGSSLHRYCAGSTVPAEFASLLAFGKACGASRAELRELQRLWVLADANRDRDRVTPEAPDGRTPGTNQDRAATQVPGDRAPGSDANRDGAATEPPDGTQTGGGRSGSDADDAAAGGTDGAAEPAPGSGTGRWPTVSRSKVTLLAAGIALLLGVGTGVAVWATVPDRTAGAPTPGNSDGRLLFTPACAEAVSQGQNDACVLEVQRLLKEAGGRLAVDGSFGPETLRRVTAFQVLAGLPPRGVVDDATKRALYDRKVSLRIWSAKQVERRIREVFVEKPDQAVAIADCQSYLDPHWLQPNPNGSRNWGVFQISDYRLTQFKATPRQALDPEWNIQAAHRLWLAHPDFSDWPSCARAARILPSSTTSAS